MMEWKKLMTPHQFREKSGEGREPLEEFKQDYSKIIFSSAFRRLKNKTQIYPLDSNDFIRTRLTHSLEVATIASELGTKIEKRLIDEGKLPEDMKECLGAVLTAASLVHDVGNPPFGHYGEFIIQDFFTDFFREKFRQDIDFYGNKWKLSELYDFKKFEGNAQALRQLNKLQYLRDEHGLNLSFPTLATIMKYPRCSYEGNSPENGVSYKKFGYFQSEEEAYKEIVKGLEMIVDGKVCRHPLVFLMEAADDIAYMMADIEDAFKKVILNNGILKDVLTKYLNLTNEKEMEILLSLGEIEVDDQYPRPWEIKMQIFRKRMHSFMMDEVIETFMYHYEDIMEGRYEKELLECSDAVHLKDAFKEILRIIISDKEVIKLEIAGDRVLRVLLREFTNAVISPKKDIEGTKESKLYRLMSSNYRFIKERYPYEKNPLYNELRLVTDFICGMTDSYALELYHSLNAIKI